MEATTTGVKVRWWIVSVNGSYVGAWYGTKEYALERARKYGDSFGVNEPPMFVAVAAKD